MTQAGPPVYVFLAGINNSGPLHWQRMWHERLSGSRWVEHTDWDQPERDAWVTDLQTALDGAPSPAVIVAHSLGCLLTAEWAARSATAAIAGAFLVAPPDPHAPAFPAAARGFDAPPATPLPFPALVVASRDDPYGDIEYARRFAEALGAGFVDIGVRGHINAESGLGDWEEGRHLLQDFVERITA